MNSFDDWDSELYHHGIKGQKWGQRRFQNEDGSLTAAGRARYYNSDGTLSKKGQKAYVKEYKKLQKLVGKADLNTQAANASKYGKRAKIAGKVAGGALAGAAAVSGGGELLGKHIRNKLFDSAKKFQGYADDWWQKEKEIYDPRIYPDLKGDQRRALGNAAADYRRENTTISETAAASGRKAYRDTVDATTKVRNVILAGAAVSAGISAYNGIRAHIAKKRLTEVGHSKAVAKAKEQADKMREMFGDIKYSDLIKKKK